MTSQMSYEPPQTPLAVKTNPMTAAHWLSDLVKLFPPTTDGGLSPERMKAMVLIFTQYPETTLREICSPLTGMATSFKFLPSMMEFGQYCAAKSASIADHAKLVEAHEQLVRSKSAPQPKPTSGLAKPSYAGPIEEIRPGDIIDHDRIEEYNTFIRAKDVIPKLWGTSETWIDSGQRPFQISEKPKVDNNPFD